VALLLVVSGPPGSGKTTLAGELSRALAAPLVSRDGIKEMLAADVPSYVPEPGDDIARRTLDTFSTVLRVFVAANVPVVAEAAFQHELWSRVLGPLVGAADVRIVRCRIDAVLADERIHLRAPDHRAVHGQSLRPGDGFVEPAFDVPTLDVETTSGYDPPLEQIVAFAR
jgi:predicted kinase